MVNSSTLQSTWSSLSFCDLIPLVSIPLLIKGNSQKFERWWNFLASIIICIIFAHTVIYNNMFIECLLQSELRNEVQLLEAKAFFASGRRADALSLLISCSLDKISLENIASRKLRLLADGYAIQGEQYVRWNITKYELNTEWNKQICWHILLSCVETYRVCVCGSSFWKCACV